MKLSASFEFSLFSFGYINIPHCSTSLSATICRTAEQFFFSQSTKPATNLLSSLRANKRASLMGKLLIVCVDRLCLRLTKIRRDNLVKVTKINSRKQLKNSLRVVAEKPQISTATEKKLQNLCRDSREETSPKTSPTRFRRV